MTHSLSRKFNVALLVLAIITVSTALYLSPVSGSDDDSAAAGTPESGAVVAPPSSGHADVPLGEPLKPTPATPTPPGRASTPSTSLPPAVWSPPSSPVSYSPSPSTPSDETSGEQEAKPPKPKKPKAPKPKKPPRADPAPKPSPSPPPPRKIEGCWSFTSQQDAQAVYAANLSDPHGLDGAKGPFDGDGLACTHLPADPDQPPSKPIGAYTPPAAGRATRDELVRPATKYFGVAEDGIPGDAKLMDKLSTQVGKAPSMVEWFSTWDEEYTATKVEKSWARGALPVISWMPAHKGNKRPWETSLQTIVDGEWDDYITRYAGSVVRTGQPVVLRFAHEQNGNWYPWSAGGNRRFERGQEGPAFKNTPALFRAAWQHVWEIFERVGANDDVIWAYTPVRANGITPNLTDQSKTNYGMTSIAQGYPGDRYVDWVGMSGYSYKGTGWSYSSTFSTTLSQLKSVAPGKPILIAETGASENTGTVSNRYRKAHWIKDTLRGLGADPWVVGLVWFNNTVVDVHTANGVRITTDNKWDTSPESLSAFTEGIAPDIWSSGKAPDTVTSQAR